MKIVILGGCGYIGSYLYKSLSKRHKVDTVDLEWFGNYSNPNNVKQDIAHLPKSFFSPYDIVILTSAHSSAPMCDADPLGAFRNNVSNFIETVNKLDHQKFIYASSSCVYVETGERKATEKEPLYPIDTLSFTKTTIDEYMIILSNIEWYGLRFGSVNGNSPNFRTDLMINSMTRSAMQSGILSVSNGNSYRPILGMEDLGCAVETVIDSKNNSGIYNVSSFNGKIEDIANATASLTGANIIKDKDTLSYDFCIDTSKFENTFGFKFIDTVESIVESIREIKDFSGFQGRRREMTYG